MLPNEVAARLIGHYLKHLTQASGLRWMPQNDDDMALLAELLRSCEASNTIPPFAYDEPPAADYDEPQPIRSDRVTQVFEREPEGNASIPDENFQRWRGQLRYTQDEEDLRRMLRQPPGGAR